MDRVAQDGMKVRANAGKSSFRRRGRLGGGSGSGAATGRDAQATGRGGWTQELTRRQRAARERAARERQQRIEEAMRQCEELQQQREATAKQSGRKVKEARASTTDPEARVMKFPDGGYRPGYNVQFATDTESGVIVGVEVTNAGTDGEQLPPMLDQLEERYERVPDEALVDGGFATMDAIDQADDTRLHGVRAGKERGEATRSRARIPMPARRATATRSPLAEPDGDRGSEVDLSAASPDGGVGQRAVPQPRPLAHAVRGQPRCRIVALLYAITHNLVVGERLCAAVA